MLRTTSIRLLALGILLAVLPALADEAETFEVDPVHSSVGFEVRHLVSYVPGGFRDFEGTIQVDRDALPQSSVEFKIATKSIDTGNPKRDDHLRSADFFDAERHPAITFKSTRIAKGAGKTYDVTGKFTMHGVTKEITIPVELLGFMQGPRGSEVAGFRTEFTVNRKDYGINWNNTLDAGGMVLSDEVTCRINLETRQKAPAADPAAAPAKPAPAKEAPVKK